MADYKFSNPLPDKLNALNRQGYFEITLAALR